ncbi:hypothetical protein FFJ24_003650 [Pedobacter sp. KBS0701]|uniref:right-handed parallel beta-helix repeat-containing protein n=1 Tax=Pedobacter sp. KBS0701 TaxID=2578106 RepID=UPI00110D8303|nr:right-handed parallel beta-helix repeat-containing protein [Pedobacter sp. KBS0701]QDW23969.1 hypothetical protein FFJ24_003650 [Pedobacter sp. KBS0701]
MTANSIYQLVNNIDPSVNGFVNVLGFYNPGDHGGGDFFWDSTANEDVDGGTIIKSAFPGVTIGRWKRRYTGELNVKWFGAKSDGSNDSVYFQNAIKTGLNIFIPEGKYAVSGLVLQGNQAFFGESTLSELQAVETDKPILTMGEFSRVKELSFYSATYVADPNFCAIKVNNHGYSVIIENLRITGGFTNAVNCIDSNNVSIFNCFISGMVESQIVISKGTHNVIENNTMEKCGGTSFIRLINAATVIIKNNYIGGSDTDRPSAQGIYAESNDPDYHFAVLIIDSNDIDNIGGQAVAVVGYYSVRIKSNWFSAGRTVGVSSVYLNGCARIDFTGNDIYTSGYMGLQMADCEVGSITNNQIEQCKDTGIFMLRCKEFCIQSNQIGSLTPKDPNGGCDMKVGLSENQGDYNIISSNIFKGNTSTNLYYEGANNVINNNISM